MNDNEIIRLLYERSETALTEVQQKYAPSCIRIARNILGNESDAEECFNDALLRLWNTVPPKHPDSLFAYISVITRNIAIDRYKYLSAEKRVRMTAVFEELENCIASPSVEVSNDALADAINGFLAEEDAVNRKLFLLRYYEANSVFDTARLLGISEASVKMRLMRIRKRLKKYLIEKGVYK